MTITGLLCGASDWSKVVVICQGLVDWLGNYVDISGGIPCERTFKKIMNAIKPERIEEFLRELATLIQKKVQGEVISIDGQIMRGTANHRADLNGIHLLNGWSSDQKLCLGQLKVDDKSNEITAIPGLIEVLDINGSIITTDALNTQKAVATKVVEGGGDYVLPVKGNQPNLLQEVVEAFEAVAIEQNKGKKFWERSIDRAKANRDSNRLEKLLTKRAPSCGAFIWQSDLEKSHGRLERRSCMTIPIGALSIKSEWAGMTSFVRIQRERQQNGKTEHETVYYISTLPPKDVDLIGTAVRKHWGVEGLHWRLDVVFRQDKSRYRNRVGARNLATLRKIALNALSNETSLKKGIATKQCVACFNSAYRDRLVKNLFYRPLPWTLSVFPLIFVYHCFII